MAMNIPEKLAREIARVTELRSQYAELDGMPNVNVKPALYLMDTALEQAKKAAGLDEVVAQVRALHSLESFTE